MQSATLGLDRVITMALLEAFEPTANLFSDDHRALRNLGTMALAILNTIERRVDRPGVKANALADMMYLPWEKRNQIVSAVERTAVKEYSHPHKRVALPDPFVDVPEMLNFRDIGGHPISPGLSVIQGLIYRSADFAGLTPLGTQKLQALGIKTVFDLRITKEITDLRIAGGGEEYDIWSATPNEPRRLHVPIFKDSGYSPEAMAERFADYSSKGTEVSDCVASPVSLTDDV